MSAGHPSRIAATFERLGRAGRGGLITYTTAGDPTLARSAAIIEALDRAGADAIEIGVPFSDPLADGPVIQRASERALAGGTTLARVLDMIGDIRGSVSAPLVLFTYVNPIARMGFGRFAERAAAAGVDGVLALDLPVEEAGELHGLLDRAGLDTIFLLSPTTTDERLVRAAALGRGFLYGISRLGVTGARDAVADAARVLAARVRGVTDLPFAIGFGISRPEHVAEVLTYADAAVVGSALVNVVAEHGDDATVIPAVESYIRWLKGLEVAPHATAGTGPAG